MGGKVEQAASKLGYWLFVLVFGVIGFPFILLIPAAIYFNVSETVTNDIANYDELVDSGLMGARLPDTIPKSVRDIREQHDLDSNRVDATFYIALDDLPQLSKGFHEAIGEKDRRGRETDKDVPGTTRWFRREYEIGPGLSPQLESFSIDTSTGFVRFKSVSKD